MHTTIIAVLALLITLTNNALAATDNPAELFPPIWEKLEFKASKFGFSATAQISYEQLEAQNITSQLVHSSSHPGLQPANAHILALKLRSSFAGQVIDFSSLLDPPSGKVLQSVRSKTILGKSEKKTYRFTEDGVLQLKTRDDGKVRNKFISIAQNDTSKNLSQPIFLFYLISVSSQLNQPGDEIELPIYANESTYLLKLKVSEEVSYTTTYTQHPTLPPTEKRTVKALKINITPHANHAENARIPVKLAGLEDGLVFYLEKASGIPLELKGNMKVFGTIRYVLQKVWTQTNTPSSDL